MSDVLSAAALDQLFRTARTQNAFQDRPVEDSQLRELYDLLKWGPTAANSSPARFVFVKSAEAKQKLAPALSEGNADKTLAAPVTANTARPIASRMRTGCPKRSIRPLQKKPSPPATRANTRSSLVDR